MLCQGSCVVVACYHRWGSSITTIPADSLRIAELVYNPFHSWGNRVHDGPDIDQSSFASNVLLILVHGCARTSTAITLWRACQSTSRAKFAIALFPVIALWALGSTGALVARRFRGETFWEPVGVDCSASSLQTHPIPPNQY